MHNVTTVRSTITAMIVLTAAMLVIPAPISAQRISDLPRRVKQQQQTEPAAPSAAVRDTVSAMPLPTPDGATAATPADGIMGEKIAAVVNDDIISTADIRARIALVLLSSGLQRTPETERQLLPQILRALVDEKLQIQEGQRLGITISPAEIEQAIKRLAEENHIANNDMPAFLAANSVPLSALHGQIRATLTWNRVVQRTLRPRVEVGEDEIDAAIAKMRANVGKEEYLLSEIYITVDTPDEEERISALTESLVQKIRAGARFGAVAQQFSHSAAAAQGGDIGWIQSGTLSAELDKALQTARGEQIVGPIRAAGGFYILGIRDKRTMAPLPGDPLVVEPKSSMPAKEILVIRQAFAALADIGGAEDLEAEADSLRKKVTSCDALEKTATQDFFGWKIQESETIVYNDAPAWLQENVSGVKVGKAGNTITVNRGALLVFVCERHLPPPPAPPVVEAPVKADNSGIDRTAILSAIGTERIELLARRLTRDLRRNAYVDVRIGR